MSKPEIVFAAYRPHAGKDAALLRAINGHLPVLRRLGLITDRTPIVVRAKDGAIIEIFEWASEDAAHKAHQHPEVAKVWEGIGAVADIATLGSLPEAGDRFPHFEPVTV
jgi:hypothetical protein